MFQWKGRRLYRVLLFIFCLGVLAQLLIIMPMSINDKGQDLAQDQSSDPTGQTSDSEKPQEADLSSDQRMSRIHMLETKEGGKGWELWSDQAKSIPDAQLVILNGVDSLFHGDKENVTYRVSGKKGVIEVPKKNLAISGNVETKTSNGYTFYSTDMKYSSENRVLSTASPVRVVGPPSEGRKALRLTGKGLKTLLDESRVEVLSDVRAEKILEKGQRAVIRSDSARFDGQRSTASFLGEVILDVDDMRITGPKADFLYDTAGDILKSVVFSGGARVSDPEKWATSDEVKVDFEKNQYVFSGDPRVMQNNDELRGEKIVFHDGGKRIQVIGARAKVDRNRLKEGN